MLLRRCVLLASLVALGCAEQQMESGTPRTVSAIERGLSDEPVGISMTPTVRRAPPQFDDADAESVRLFYDVLGPFGTWVDDSRLGLVWIPSKDGVGDGFVPYGTHGRWTHRELSVVTERGAAPYDEYIWVSELPWGWVTFHYGRWAYTGERGWAWIAGRRYAGAWVDWRVPHGGASERGRADSVVGWGPTPPAHVWRIAPGPRPTRARVPSRFDPRDVSLTPVPYAAFATPYTYTRTRDLFAPDLSAKLLSASSVFNVAHATDPTQAPSPRLLGYRNEEVPGPPTMDRGLQQAWMLATPATASAIGAGPELGAPPRLRTWVAGGRYTSMVH
jgi:hypothetical protein